MSRTSNNKLNEFQNQLAAERKMVSFDSYDITVRQLVDMYMDEEIYIPEEYQRQFVWGEDRESQLIESVFLGIPVPSLFMATNQDATWEVVDGVQRLCTLAHYVLGSVDYSSIGKKKPLEICELEKLSALNGSKFLDLPKTIQLGFMTRPIRVTVLNDKSDTDVRFDLFERLNTGGISLTSQEIRNCIYRGELSADLKTLARNKDFNAVVKVKPVEEKNGTKEEMILRFYAFLKGYTEFEHSVKGFLNDFMRDNRKQALSKKQKGEFEAVFRMIHQVLPGGINRGTRKTTPVNLFEAISVGTALALRQSKQVKADRLAKIIVSERLHKYTTGATNSRRMVTSRIEYVRDSLLK